MQLLFPDGTEMQFANGAEAAKASFEKRYLVDMIRLEGNAIDIQLKEPEPMSLNWAGEESVSYF